MPRRCTLCDHPDRAAVDRALLTSSYRDIARQFGIKKDATARHKTEHLPELLARAYEAEQVAQANDLLREVQALRAKAYRLLMAAEAAGDLRTALLGVREARSCLELLGEMEGKLNRQPQFSLVVMPEWVRTRTVLLEALRPYPEARQAVADRLVALGAG